MDDFTPYTGRGGYGWVELFRLEPVCHGVNNRLFRISDNRKLDKQAVCAL